MASKHSFSSEASVSTAATATSATTSSSDNQSLPKKLFLGVPYHTSRVELELLVEQYGRVRNVHIPLNDARDKNRGFAFVTFFCHEDAADAIDGLEGEKFQGMILHPRWAEDKKQNAPKKATKSKRCGSHKRRNKRDAEKKKLNARKMY